MNVLSNSAYQNLSNEELYLISNYKQCPVHPKRKLTCISTDPTSKYYLKCLDCLTLSEDKHFLPLLSVLDSDNKTIFKSWPVINDSEFYNELVDISQKKSFAEDTKEQIKSFFKQFRAQIDQVLEDKQLEMMNQSDSLWNINENVLNQYNQLCGKDELKDILLNKKDDFEKQNKILGETISRILHNQEGNKKAILNSMNHLKNQINTIDFEYPNKLKANIIQQVKEIDLFLIKDLGDIQLNKINQGRSLKDIMKEVKPVNMTTSQLIIKLINNKLNNCSDKLLDQLNNTILRVEGYLNKTEINGINNEQIIELDKLEQKQLSNMKQLTKNYLEDKSKLTEPESLMKSKQTLLKLINNKFNFCSQPFLNCINDLLDKYSFILEEIDFTNISTQGNTPISTDHLTNSQISEFKYLIQGFSQINQRNLNMQINPSIQKTQKEQLTKFNSLISNKSNYCQQEYIDYCQIVSTQYPEIVSQIYLNNYNIFQNNYTHPIVFDHLDDKQLNRIQLLVDKMSELSQQFGNDYKNGQSPSENRQPNSYQINTCLSSNKDFLSKKEFSQLLNDYPICELSNLQFSKYLTLNLDFIKTNYKNSQELKIERMQEGKIRIIQEKSLTGQIVTQNKLDVNTNYIFRCQIINRKLNVNYLSFGIMKSSKIHTDYLKNEKCCYITTQYNYGLDSIVQGKYLSSVGSEIDCVEVRVNIAKKILMYADYPNYRNINSTYADKIEQNADYSFGIYFATPGDNIVVEVESLTTIDNHAFSQFS